MLRLDLPYSDASLLLTPRFGDHYAVVQAALLAACFLPLILVAWLYRYELRLVRRSAAGVLLGLRSLVVFAILFLLTFQPVVARVSAESTPGRVVVALDVSDSMGVSDPQRAVADKLRIARGLHLARDLCSDSELGVWIQHPPGDSASPDDCRRFDAVCRRVDGLSRAQIARAVLSAVGAGLLSAVDRRHQLDFIGFAATGSPLDAAEIDRVRPPTDGSSATDLRVPLVRGLEGTKPLAVVVLTDGQHNGATSPVEKAAELAERGVPVYAVAVGAKVPPTDIAVTTVQAPSTVFKGSDAAVEARLEVRGLPARTIEVELQRAGQPPLVESVAHDGTDRGYTVRFSPRLDEVGTQVLTVHARPAPEELRTENNSRPVAVNVADDKARVLLVDGEARWEFHYLASALARDPGIDLTRVLFEQPRVGRLGEAELRAAGHPLRALPAGPDALDRFDCVILGDVTPDQLPPDDRGRVERFVGERGGTLVVLAGPRAMPLAYLVEGPDADPLRKLLPIETGQALQVPSGFPIELTTEGRQTTFMRLAPAAEGGDRPWDAFPRQFWGVVGKVKPASAVLATFRPAANPATPDPAGWARNNALIAHQNYGFGRVLYVGVDGTWRWRFKVGDVYHHRFWGQVTRWAASDTPLLAGNEFVRFGPRKPVVAQGQPVEIGVRFGERAGAVPAGDAAVRIVRLREGQADEPVGQVPLQAIQARSRELEARVHDLPPGRYAAELAIPSMAEQLRGGGGPGGVLRAPFTVSSRPSTEMIDLATNYALLEEIAAKTGGRVFTPDSASDLADLLAAATAVHEVREETKLWQAWPTLVVFLTFVTAEWLVRKWAGLP